MPKRAGNRETSPGGHSRDEDSFAAFMESCRSDPHRDLAADAPRGHPEPRGDHTEGTPLTVSRQSHLQRDYTALCMQTGHAAATDNGPATASGAVDQAPDERSAQGGGKRVEAGTNTTSERTGPPPGNIPSWGRGHPDYAR